jgi:hypothetical protein
MFLETWDEYFKIKFMPLATHVRVTNDSLSVVLADAREITVPLEWFPRLRKATKAQRAKWRLIGGGVGIHWEDVDEDVSVAGLLAK